jgi:hypothetical protein
MPTRRPAVPALVLAVPLVLTFAAAGCATEDPTFEPGLKPGAEGITAVIEVYAAGFAAGDGPLACSMMSAAAQRAVVDRSGSGGNCLAAVTAISEALPGDAAAALRDLEVGDISGAETTSASASVAVSGPGADAARTALGGTSFRMTVTDARWGIDAVEP